MNDPDPDVYSSSRSRQMMERLRDSAQLHRAIAADMESHARSWRKDKPSPGAKKKKPWWKRF